MSRLDAAQVRHVARLARLDLTEDQVRLAAHQLGAILDYVAKIDALDVSRVEPTSHGLALTNALRADQVRPSLAPDEALANAPEREGGCFRVPPIIQEL